MTKNWLDYKLRILNTNGTFVFIGEDANRTSYFTVEQAGLLCDYSEGQKIVRWNGVQVCEEVFVKSFAHG